VGWGMEAFAAWLVAFLRCFLLLSVKYGNFCGWPAGYCNRLGFQEDVIRVWVGATGCGVDGVN
jgi:hypothetical protein